MVSLTPSNSTSHYGIFFTYSGSATTNVAHSLHGATSSLYDVYSPSRNYYGEAPVGQTKSFPETKAEKARARMRLLISALDPASSRLPPPTFFTGNPSTFMGFMVHRLRNLGRKSSVRRPPDSSG